jgi:hypothetical protein
MDNAIPGRLTVFLLLSRAAIAVCIAAVVYGLRPTTAIPQESATTSMTATRSTRPPDCKVTLPVDESFTPPAPFPKDPELWPLSWGLPPPPGSKRFWFGTETLWTVLPADGTWGGFEIGDPAFVYNNKLPWFALSEDEGQLTITGKKLDEPNLSFTEFFEINRFGRTKTGIEEVMGGISFPASGCWQVTGHFTDRELSFVVWVRPIVRHERPHEDPRPAWTVGLALPADPVPVDGEVEAKRIVYRSTPEIPPRAKLSNVSGTLVLHAIIGGNDGVPRELQYVSGPPFLVKSAMDAVQLWRYRADGRTDIDTTIEVVFPSSE